MYQKLLLNCDGGIIDATQQSEQDNCAVVAIGLGGTGVDCLKNLKAKVYNRVRPDNPDSSIATYSHIKFLAVDTDKTGLVESNASSTEISKIDLDTEFFDLSYLGNINELLKDSAKILAAKPEYKEWLRYEDIKVASARSGAGGVRQLGRYLFMEKAQTFVTKVKTLVSSAKTGLILPKVYVHIFSGMGGGTGAGTFLDVCYLVREALRLEGANAYICGYFFLPDVNLAKNLDRETAAYVQVNGYASMQELDYCMNFESNGDKWSQRYTGLGLIETNYPPVDMCHLITAKDAMGNNIPNAYNYAMNVVTDYFMDFLIKTDAEFTMASHIANFVNRKEQLIKEHGAQYEYCVLGASNATLPFKEVLTYLAAKMFERFEGIRKYNPTKAQVEEFIAKNGLRYDALFAQLTQNCDMSFPRPDVKWKDAKGNDELTVTFFKDHQARVKQFLERNFVSMGRDLENYNPVAENTSNAVGSIISKVFKALRAVAVDPERGPYSAAAILRSTAGSDLIAMVDGHLAEVRSKYEQENVQGDRLQRTREQAQRDFFENSNIFNGNKKYERYRDATRSLIIHDTRLVVFSKMDDLLTRLRKQLTALGNNFTDVFKSTIGNLIDTFVANRDYLDSMADNVSTYEFPLVHIQDLKGNLNQTIKEMNVSEKAKDFLTYMLSEEGIQAWIASNENEIAKLVTKYFNTLFSLYSRRTMTSYLQDKYNTKDSAQLIKSVRDDIMNMLDMNATPLFWASPLYSIDNASKIGYISVPDTCEEVVQAASSLREARQELSVRKTDIRDRITLMRCLVGAPLYGYQGLLQYERNSVGATNVGKNLYEGRDYVNDNGQADKGRDWRHLPSPSSFSLMNNKNSDDLRKNAEEASKLYAEAESKQIITMVGPNEYGIRIIAPSFMEQIRGLRNSAINKSNEEKLEALGQINNLKNNIVYETNVIKILNDGSALLPDMNKRLVRIDHFAASPRHQEMVKREKVKLKEIDDIIAALEPKVDNDLVEFHNALFTGTISFTAPVVEYEDKFGAKTVLSSPDMQCGGAPLYQALINFKALEEDIRVEIREESEQVLKTFPLLERVVNSCNAINQEMKNVKFMIEEATEVFPHEVKDLREFLTKTKDNLTRFSRKYRINLE
jgi:hypothetical protein